MYLYYSTIKDPKVVEVTKKRAGCLAYLEDPSKEEIEKLAEEDMLELDLLLDGLDPNEAPRIEKWESKVYVYSRFALPEEDKKTTASVLVIFGADMVYVVSREPFTDFVKMMNRNKPPIVTSQRSKLLLEILATINVGYKRRINQAAKKIYELRSHLDRSHIDNKDFITFIDIEEDLNDMLLALEPMNALLNSLLTGKDIRLYTDDQDLVEDLELNSDELIRIASSQLKTLKNIRDAYSTMTANNLNRVFKLMTGITILIGVSTLITGFYGMNIQLPADHNPNAVWIIIGGLSALTTISVAIFKKNRWF